MTEKKPKFIDRVRELVSVVVRGDHHFDDYMSAKGIEPVYENGAKCLWCGDMATWDGDILTRLVVLCHEERIRLSIHACTPYHMRIYFSERQAEGSTPERHPDISSPTKASSSATRRLDNGAVVEGSVSDSGRSASMAASLLWSG